MIRGEASALADPHLGVAGDNDFLSSVNGVPNPNQWFVFGVTDRDLAQRGDSHVPQALAPVPEPESHALILAGLAALGCVRRRAR